MSNSELLSTYLFFKEETKNKTDFCKENGYFEKFGSNDYARLKTENEMLKQKIELMERGII